MFENFTLRHLPPLWLATQVSIGGMMPYIRGSEASLKMFGFPANIPTSKAAWPVIKVGSARVTTIGIAIWGMYLGGHFEAMDILLAATAWTGMIDAIVCQQEGAPGSTAYLTSLTGMVVLWGMRGMRTG